MIDSPWLEQVREGDGSIVLLVLDGLGGIPHPKTGKTELEAARTPNLDALAARSSCGLADPVARGITPGSGAGHLALFGYDPVRHLIGRGALSAAGVGFPLKKGDLAARVNFCTLDVQGKVTDRRAGRIPTETCRGLCDRIREAVHLEGVELFLEPEREYRAVAVFRGEGLDDRLTDSDPQQEGVLPRLVEPLETDREKEKERRARRTAEVVNRFLRQAGESIRDRHPANGLLLRGFAHPPEIASFRQRYCLDAAAAAVYPMYRGIASLVGMELLEAGASIETQCRAVGRAWGKHAFFFIHVKGTDSAAEDGDFDRKVSVIEQVDAKVPDLLALKPDVFVVTGDHATPSVMRSHSFHPVPVLLHAATAFAQGELGFSERICARGGMLGRFPMKELMPQLLAHAGRLAKYGA
jgi:2,3-bisphosphoglycerate-independent phosphoglycerate mutase